jgi:hypothetical protein
MPPKAAKAKAKPVNATPKATAPPKPKAAAASKEKPKADAPDPKAGTAPPEPKAKAGVPDPKAGTVPPVPQAKAGAPDPKPGTVPPTPKPKAAKAKAKPVNATPKEKPKADAPDPKAGTVPPVPQAKAGVPDPKPGKVPPTPKPKAADPDPTTTTVNIDDWVLDQKPVPLIDIGTYTTEYQRELMAADINSKIKGFSRKGGQWNRTYAAYIIEMLPATKERWGREASEVVMGTLKPTDCLSYRHPYGGLAVFPDRIQDGGPKYGAVNGAHRTAALSFMLDQHTRDKTYPLPPEIHKDMLIHATTPFLL